MSSRKCSTSAAQHLPRKFPHTPYAKLRATATQGGRPFRRGRRPRSRSTTCAREAKSNLARREYGHEEQG